MALPLLLPLLASLQMLPRLVSPADTPASPTLSLKPSRQLYLTGESVQLTCSAPPSNHTVTGFQFSRVAGEIISSGNSDTHTLSYVTQTHTGSYTCAYWVEPSGRRMESVESPAVSINVTARPPAPRLSQDPRYTVYLPGERVTLTCSAPGRELASGYRFFYQERQQPFSLVQPPNEGAQLELTAGKGNAGTYTCVYWRRESNRVISSWNSDFVSITVTDPPPAPTLSQDHRYTVYLPGERVNLMCSTPGDELASGYRFFYQGQQEPSVVQYLNEGAWLVLRAEKGKSGTYTCAYWRWESNREISSGNSNSVSITVTAHPPAPRLSQDPRYTVYLLGERVTLTCSTPGRELASGYRFFYQERQQPFSVVQPPNEGTQLELTAEKGNAGTYTCAYWRRESNRVISSWNSDSVSITVTDPPPQPVLRLDPPSGAVSEGLSLLIICAVSRDATREWRFHFYKDGVKIDPGDMGYEINTTEPGTSSRNVSVLRIPQAGPNNSGEFTCGYEKNVSGRWIPSPRSRAVNVTVNVTGTASHNIRDVLLTTGGILFLVGAIAALICYCRRKKRVPKPQKSTEGSEPRVCARNLRPAHDNQGSKARVLGAEQMEQGSEVTYALMEFPALEAQATQPKNKAKPAEAEHVLYSEVVTTHTQKTAK